MAREHNTGQIYEEIKEPELQKDILFQTLNAAINFTLSAIKLIRVGVFNFFYQRLILFEPESALFWNLKNETLENDAQFEQKTWRSVNCFAF